MLTSRPLFAALLAVATLTTTATAQRSRPAPGPSIVVGPMLGVSFSSLSTSDEAVGIDIRHRTGFVAGGFVTFNASSHVAVEPQLLYIQKGATAVTTSSGFNSRTYALDYIQVPVLLKGRYWFGDPAKGLTIDPFIGPAIAFNVHCAIEVLGVTSSCSALGVNASSVDVSGIFGIGAEFAGLSLQGRYDVSFTDAYDTPTSPGAPAQNKAKNLAWVITLGYKFPLR